MNKQRIATALLIAAIFNILGVLVWRIIPIFQPDFYSNDLGYYIFILIVLVAPMVALIFLKQLKQSNRTRHLYTIMIVAIALLFLYGLIVWILGSTRNIQIYMFMAESEIYHIMQTYVPAVLSLTIFILSIILFCIEGIKNNPMMFGLTILFIMSIFSFTNIYPFAPTSDISIMIYESIVFLFMILWALGAINIVLKVYRDEKVEIAT
ncbi:MAG: hypothetical protein KAQ68_08380 [Clostridiales bacterium]|nr:hypothetical protein [Clostridiales bacterium]